MYLQKITLKNIRSYEDCTVEFPKGSVLLAGDIGAGKTTILMALEFALFGVKGSGISYNSLLRNGEVSGSVELHFSIGDSRFIVKRNLKRTKDSVKQNAGSFTKNDVLAEGTPEEIRAWVIKELGYPLDAKDRSLGLVFRYSVYTPQEAMKFILLEKPDDRIDIIRKILQIDKYQKIRDNSLSYAKELRRKTQELSGRIFSLTNKEQERKQLRENLDDVKEQWSEGKRLVKQKKEEKEQLFVEFEELKEKEETLRAKHEGLKLKKQMILDKTEGIKKIDEKILQCVGQIQKLESQKTQHTLPNDLSDFSLKVNSQREALEKEFQEISEKQMELKKREVDLQNKKEVVKKDIQEKEQKEDLYKKLQLELNALHIDPSRDVALRQKRDDLKKRHEALLTQLGKEKGLLDEKTQLITRISQLTSCPVCLQEVKGEYKDKVKETNTKLIEKKTKFVLSLEDETEKLQKELHEVHQEEEKLERQKTECREKELVAKQLEKDIALLTAKAKQEKDIFVETQLFIKDKEALESAQKKHDDNVELNKRDLVKLHELELLAQKIKQINEFLKEKKSEQITLHKEKKEDQDMILSLEEEISASAGIEKHYELLLAKRKVEEERFIKVQEGYNKAEVNLAGVSAKLTELQKQETILLSEIKNLRAIKQQMQDYQEKENWLSGFFVKLVRSIEKHVLLAVHSEFSELFVDWFSLLVDDEALSVRLDDEFTPVIVQNNYEIDFVHLSGGEKTALSLAYRLALNKVINDFISTIATKELLILDEPTDGFSAFQLDKIRDVLDQLHTTQTIIVSHEAKIESFVDSVIYVKKEGHVSVVS